MDTLAFYVVQAVTTTDGLDLGEAAPSSSDDTLLRVVNTSDQYLAEDVTVSITGPAAIQLWLSDDGESFHATLAVGDIGPAGSSSTFWLRRVTASTVAAGNYHAALSAAPTGWTSAADRSTSTNVPLDTEDS